MVCAALRGSLAKDQVFVALIEAARTHRLTPRNAYARGLR